eukprot:gene13006-3505_t
MSARWGTRSSRSAMDPPIPMYPAQVSMYNALKPDVAGLSHSSKEEAVREHYLSSTGLQTALRDAIKSLFMETKLPANPYYYLADQTALRDAIKSLFMESKLPANPYYYLADVLSTYVDQSPTWMMSDEELMEPYGVEGMVDVVDSSNRLCKNNNSTHAYGLPHVIRLTNKRGINSLHAILTEQLPDSFFPTSQPFTLSEEDFMIQAMCSVQLDIRADILIKGPSLEEAVRLEVRAYILINGLFLGEAVRLFLDLLVHGVEDLMDIPVYLLFLDLLVHDVEDLMDIPVYFLFLDLLVHDVEDLIGIPVYLLFLDLLVHDVEDLIGIPVYLLFLDLLVHDVEDLMDIPVYFVTGVDFEDVASKPLDANGQRDKFVQNVPIEQIYSDPDGFDRDGQRLPLDANEQRDKFVQNVPIEQIYSDPDGFDRDGQRLPLDANGQWDKFVQNVPIEQIYSDPDGFDRDGQRLILGNKCAKINLVAMLDEGGRAAYDSVRTHPENATLRYKMVTKTYYFHYSRYELSSVVLQQLSHYGSLPYEALFEGYFADKAAAKHYMGMYVGTKSESRLPYWDDNRVPNIEVLVNQISSLDDVALGAQRSKREGNGREEDQILSTIPNLLRIICSAANTLRGYAHEMEALHIASEKWPAKFAFLKATASNKPGHTPLLREDGLYSAPGTGDSRRTLRTPEVSDAMLVWLKTADMNMHLVSVAMLVWLKTVDMNVSDAMLVWLKTVYMDMHLVSDAMLVWLKTVDMNARLVGQLIQLKKGITASTGKRLFSGCSVILQLMFGIVPDEVPPMGSAHIVSTMQRVSVHAVSLLHVLALTVSHGFLARCQDVLWALKAMEMNLKSRLDRVLMGVELIEDDPMIPEWELDVVDAVGSQSHFECALMGVELIEDDPMIPEWELDVVDAVGSQVNLGGLAARVGVEGVMLQYAVDTKLDELLSVLWHQATQPPMPINPFPRLMLIIRSVHATLSTDA